MTTTSYLRRPALCTADMSYYAVPDDFVGLDSDGDFVGDDVPDYFIELADDFTDAQRILALLHHLDEFTTADIRDTTVTIGRREWLVLTDDEADKLQDQQLDSLIDEMGLEDSIRRYFDEEAWKRDARIDGRGSHLASEDGEEHVEKVANEYDGEETYYLYRTC